jgi:uncharacterized membrane protein
MRVLPLSAALSLALCGAAHATGTFTALETPGALVTMISPNGEYAVASLSGGGGVRWTAETGEEDPLSGLNVTLGINDAGTVSGAVPVNGGAANGGDDLGAYLAVDGTPVQLTDPIDDDSNGYAISDDNTIVGLAFASQFAGAAVAFVWTADEGMTALPVNRPDNYSRANVISADGHTIAGWNDQDDGGRTAVVWQDRVQHDIADADGNAVGEADGISDDGAFVVGGGYADADGNQGSWRWNAATGSIDFIPGMSFAFAVSHDGKTIVGATGFFDDPPRAAMIWREGVGTVMLQDFLTENGIDVPDGWDFTGGLTALSADGRTIGGWGFGPDNHQGYIIQLGPDDAIFADGFDPPL